MMSSMRGVTKRIQSIKFALLSPDEIRRMSATKIITADTYDDDGFPIDMGLMDSHLGVIEPGLRCKTCGQRVGDCPGHFGHIDLAMPVIHVGFVKTIRNCLRATCRQCGKILFTKEDRDKYYYLIYPSTTENKDIAPLVKRVVKDASLAETCPHCTK